MAFCPFLTYGAHWGRFWWHFAPFYLTGPIRADFDGHFAPLLTYESHKGRFWCHFAPLWLMGHFFVVGKLMLAGVEEQTPQKCQKWGIFSWLLIGCWGIVSWLLIGCRDFFLASDWLLGEFSLASDWLLGIFWLMGPIKADFDGIFSPFYLWHPLR